MILPVSSAVVTSPYGMRVLQGETEFHDGIDFISRESNEVLAIAPGVVVHDVDDYDHSKRWKEKYHSAGNYVIIRHDLRDGHYFCRYLHLGENLVAMRDKIEEGALLGYYGDYGRSFGAHVHFDMYDANWTKIDPTQKFLQEGLL